MKKLQLVVMAGLCVAFITGCTTGLLNSHVTTTTTTISTNGTPVTVTEENTVTALRGAVLVNPEVEKAKVKWGDVEINIGGLSSKGDTEMANAIAEGIIGGITAYYTAGASSVAKGVVKGMSASSVADTNKEAVTEEKTEEPEATSDTSAPPPKPIITKVNTASDVVAGKYAVVVIGNRKGCPLCRSLWKEGFEANVEQALPNADVIDADMTDNPQLYKKYFPSEKFVYPYCVIFDAQGKRIGAFTARGEGASNFTGKVSEICPSCKP